MQVKMYTRPGCPFCDMARDLLTQKGIEFEEDASSWLDPQLKGELIRESGMMTVPQIWCDGKLIGGFDDLSALNAQDGLKSMGAQ